MPRRYLALVFVALVGALFAACGDGDDDGDPTATAERSESPSATDSDDKETPEPGEETLTPVPQSTDVTPTAPPVNPQGTPAVEPADADDFIAQFQGQDVDFQACAYNPATALVNCPNVGVFAIDPPITGQDIECTLWVIATRAVAVQCKSQEPLQTRYYGIN
jgi:hypothetical protein